MALTAPAMTPADIDACPLFAPPVRVTCYPCKTTLFVGEQAPDGGAPAVFSAAGCAKGACPGKNPSAYPAPATPPLVELGAVTPVLGVQVGATVTSAGVAVAATTATPVALP